jgi:hypothetical protein
MPLRADNLASAVEDAVPAAFIDLALGHSNDELMRLLGVDRATVVAWRKATGLHRQRGTKTLPAPGRCDTSMTLAELARACGWGSVYRFTEALRLVRPTIYQQVRDNSRARSLANLRRAAP